MEVIFKFKKEIFGLIFVGVIILVILYFLAPDRSEQIFNTLTLLAVLLITLPIFLILMRYFIERR